MDKYLISIIIPTYNAEKYIISCIDSLINQNFNFNELEIIFIDDNSTDNTKQILQEYSHKYPNIKLILNDTNSGSPSKPRNIGIANASSEFVMFLDNDDKYAPEMCNTMYNTIINENVDIVACRCLITLNNEVEDNKNYLDKEKEFIKFNSIEEHPTLMSSGEPMCVWNKIFKKKLLTDYNIRFPEKILNEDVYFMTQAYLNANGIVLLNDFWGYNYMIRNENGNKSTSQNFTEENIIKQLSGLKKIIKILNDYDAYYPALESEMLIGWTKLFILTNPHDDLKKKLLNSAKELYKNYKLTVKLVNVSLPVNILINIFIKIFSINTSVSIFLTKFFNLFLKK